MSAALISRLANLASLAVNIEHIEEEVDEGVEEGEEEGGEEGEEEGEEESEEEEDDNGDEVQEKPRLSKRQCSHMGNVDMRIDGRYLCNGRRAYDQDTLRNSGKHPEDKRFPRQMKQHHDNDEGMLPFQSSARLARYFSESNLGPLIQRLSGQEVQPPSSAPASLVYAADSAGETPQPLIDSSAATTLDSALQLKGLIPDGNPEPTYVAVTPTANTSTSSVEGLESFLKGTFEGFAIMSPLLLVALIWLVVVLKRAKKQRRAARIEHEMVGPYPSPVVETKADLESASV